MRPLIEVMILCCSLALGIAPCEKSQDTAKSTTETSTESSLAKSAMQSEILVKFKDNVSQDSITALSAAASLIHVRTLRGIGVQVFRVPEGRSVEAILQELQKNPQVEYAERNQEYRIPEKPN